MPVEGLLFLFGVMAVVGYLVWLMSGPQGQADHSEEIGEERAERLVRDAVEWAEDRFPPPKDRYPNTPDASPAHWYVYASTAAIEVAILSLAGRERVTEDRYEAFTEAVGHLLDDSHPVAKQALWTCSAQLSAYLSEASEPDLPFFLGMWLWKNLFEEQPSTGQGRDLYKLGQLVVLSFNDWWESGVRHVVIGDDGSALVVGQG